MKKLFDFLYGLAMITALLGFPLLVAAFIVGSIVDGEDTPTVQTQGTKTVPIEAPEVINETPVKELPVQQAQDDSDLCVGYPTVCEDLTCSSSVGRGTCSYHGGVLYYR